MKKTIVASLATFGLTLGVFAQGQVSVDNTANYNPSLTLGNNSTFYSGAIQVQTWYDNSTSVANLSTIQSDANLGTTAGTQAAYALLIADGFSLAQTLTGTITAGNAGAFSLGVAHNASMAVGSVTLALLAINSTSAAWDATGTSDGLVAFVNPTTQFGASPAQTASALTGWTANNLIMTPAPVTTPEPATIAFAALGLGSFLVARRRK